MGKTGSEAAAKTTNSDHFKWNLEICIVVYPNLPNLFEDSWSECRDEAMNGEGTKEEQAEAVGVRPQGVMERF